MTEHNSSPTVTHELADRHSHTRSESRTGKFMRSLSIPLSINTMSPESTSTSYNSTAPTTPSRSKSFVSPRSNSVSGVAFSMGEDLSLGKRIRRRLTSKGSNQATHSTVSSLTRTRSNSLRLSIDTPSNNNSPIFNTNSFSDITEDYFKYDSKKKNKSISSSADSYTRNGSSICSNDPLDVSSQNFEGTESVSSSASMNPDLTLSQIFQKQELTVDEEDYDEEQVAESMAFDILQKIKDISVAQEIEDQHSI